MLRLRRLAAAVLATAAAGLLTICWAGPAEAATCADADGVSVVVDFKQLGGGAQSVCDAGGGGTKASALFTGNGFELTYAQRTPGFVCRVQGLPASDPCINTAPTNAYWGLWWSDGSTGKWSYSSLGAGSLTVPAGGSVAFAWDGVDGQASPGVAPPKQAAGPSATATPSPSPSPTVKPTPTVKATPSARPTPTPTPTATVAPTETPTATSTPTPTPTVSPTATPTPTPTATPTPSETVSGDEVEQTSAPVDADNGGLPVWVPVLVILALFGVAGAVVVRRRSGA